jgi:putative transposase
MRPSKFTEEQIVQALQRVISGTPAVEVCRTLGITETTFYRWRRRHAGLTPSETSQLSGLRDENQRLRQIVTDLLLEKQRIAEQRKPK